MGLAIAVDRIFNLIELVLFVFVLLTWFPNIKWQNEPFYTLKNFSELFFAPFRKIIPPIGMIDISPVIAFIIIGIIQGILVNILSSVGL